jgi:hypothetical protein
MMWSLVWRFKEGNRVGLATLESHESKDRRMDIDGLPFD